MSQGRRALIMTTEQAVRALARRLASVSPTAPLDAELLVAHAIGTSRAALAADPARRLGEQEARAIEALARRRAEGEPVAYLTGRREFWSLELEITPDVLVPRPETELLVELTLASLAAVAAPRILDLGTGSGAIALALARERADAAVTATDASDAALGLAARNARHLGIGNVDFVRGSWYEAVPDRRFDGVVSNPPYVAEGDPALLTLAREPRIALVAEGGGLGAIASILSGAGSHLVPGGFLAVEHGASQGAAVRELMAREGLVEVATHRDLASHERVTTARRGAH
jgi:release factor glutamine methyltransferase